MDLEAMAKAGVSKQDLFAALREHSYHNLASVKRVYFEACGMLNIYEESQKKAGLAVYPSNEDQLVHQAEKDGAHVVCKNCGFVVENANGDDNCRHCGKKQWMAAIY
ncbi:MAG TPA: YetF domain-containing protein [Cyclobacteriaceae bacterium]|nr:YetF domain-containing protein [Cyclobacteriaceae bacterium]